MDEPRYISKFTWRSKLAEGLIGRQTGNPSLRYRYNTETGDIEYHTGNERRGWVPSNYLSLEKEKKFWIDYSETIQVSELYALYQPREVIYE